MPAELNTRERFVRTLLGRDVDRAPFIKVFGGDNAIVPAWEKEHPGIGREIDARHLAGRYEEHRRTLAARCRSDLHVVVDCANGSGFEVAPRILAATGARRAGWRAGRSHDPAMQPP